MSGTPLSSQFGLHGFGHSWIAGKPAADLVPNSSKSYLVIPLARGR